MSELINNLNSIYNTKLAIKEVIGTNSDTFSEYPTLISERIAAGVSGYSYITSNGDYDISTYEYVNVNVPGSIAVLGEGSGNENGRYLASDYNLDGFSSFDVNVPIPPGYIVPTGTYQIISNGMYDISTYESAYVNVQSGPSTDVPNTFEYISKTELENSSASDQKFAYTNNILYTYAISGAQVGSYTIAAGGATFILDGLDWYNGTTPAGSDGRLYYFSGNNPNIRNTSSRTITMNGNYNIADDDPIQNWGHIVVNVSGGSSTITVSGRYLLRSNESDDAGHDKYIVYDSTNSTYYTLANELGYAGAANNPKFGDTVTVTGDVIYGNIIKPTTYSVTNVGSYEYMDISSFGLSGYGSETICNITDGIYNSDKNQTHSYVWNVMGGDNYGIDFVKDGFNNFNFEGGNTITAYIYKEGDGTGYDYYTYTYYIRDIVSNISPTILGMSYSLDGGMNWTNMDYDSSTTTYSFGGINISQAMSTSTPIRFDIGNGNYQYVRNGITFNTANTDYTDSISKSTMFENFSFWNYTGYDGTVSGSINSTGTSITARLNADSSVYKFVHECTTDGNVVKEEIIMYQDPMTGNLLCNPSFLNVGTNNNYYVSKYADNVNMTPIETYKCVGDQSINPGAANAITLSSAGTGILDTIPSGSFSNNKVYFNKSTLSLYWIENPTFYVKDSNSNTLTSFKQGGMAGSINLGDITWPVNIHIEDSNGNIYFPSMIETFTPSSGSGSRDIEFFNDSMYLSNYTTLNEGNYMFNYSNSSEGYSVNVNIYADYPRATIKVIDATNDVEYSAFRCETGYPSQTFSPESDVDVVFKWISSDGLTQTTYKMDNSSVSLEYLDEPDWQSNNLTLYSVGSGSGNFPLSLKAGKRYSWDYLGIGANDIQINVKGQTITNV